MFKDSGTESNNAEEYESSSTGRVVTTSHYVKKSDRLKCQNKLCGLVFGYPTFRRPHHCTRCGEIFCRPCLKNTRRLNRMAQIDPLGIPCKVCPVCFADRTLVLGVPTRSLSEEYKTMRTMAKKEMNDIKCDVTISERRGTVIPAFWKDQFDVDILKECHRLLEGFRMAVGQSDTRIAFQELTKYMEVPEWQRSTFWALEQHADCCRQCHGKWRQTRNTNCRVCGLALCKTCAQRELLIYYENGKRNVERLPRIAVIRYEGAPSIEPRFSMILYSCKDCLKLIIERQLEDVDWFKEKPEVEGVKDVIDILLVFDEKFRNFISEMTKGIEKVTEMDITEQTLTEYDLGDQTDSPEDQTCIKGSLKESIRDRLSDYQKLWMSLKSICTHQKRLITGARAKLVQNYLVARSEFYHVTNTKVLKMEADTREHRKVLSTKNN